MVHRGDADGMLCGLVGRYDGHLEHVRDVIGQQPGAQHLAALNALMLPNRTLFIADTFVNEDPSAEELADIALIAAAEVRRFGLAPKVAFLSHSIFGSSARAVGAADARGARHSSRERARTSRPTARCRATPRCRKRCARGFLPETTLAGSANLLVLPNLDAANILFNVLKMTGGNGVTVGPILLGAARPVHVLTPSATVRRVVNMTALAVADAAEAAGGAPTRVPTMEQNSTLGAANAA